jgi:hypothetical protein
MMQFSHLKELLTKFEALRWKNLAHCSFSQATEGQAFAELTSLQDKMLGAEISSIAAVLLSLMGIKGLILAEQRVTEIVLGFDFFSEYYSGAQWNTVVT